MGLRRIRLLQTRNNKRGCFARPIFCSGQDITILQNDWNRLLLNGRRFFEALLKDSHEELALEKEVFKVSALGLSDIFCLVAGVFFGGNEAILIGARACYFLSVFWWLYTCHDFEVIRSNVVIVAAELGLGNRG